MRRKVARRGWTPGAAALCCWSGLLIVSAGLALSLLLPRGRRRPGGWEAVPLPDAAEGPSGAGFFGLPEPTELGHVPGFPKWVPRPGRDFAVDYDIQAELRHASAPEYQPPKGREPALTYPALHTDLWTTISVRPRVLLFPRILTDDEADRIRELAESRLTRSEVRPSRGGHGKTGARTSRGTFLRTDAPLWMRRIRDRLTNVTGISRTERLQVLRYEAGQHYWAHHDYFDPARYGPQATNRAATFFMFLEDMPKGSGGETSWPRAGGGPESSKGKWSNSNACSTGLQLYPRKGAAVLFYNMRPDGRLDPHAVHAGCDVINGTKWSAPLWFRVSKPLYVEAPA